MPAPNIIKSLVERFELFGETVNLSKEYLSQIPIHTINFSNPAEKAMHDKMVSLVERMLALHKQPMARTPQQQGTVKRAPGKAPGIIRSSPRMVR